MFITDQFVLTTRQQKLLTTIDGARPDRQSVQRQRTHQCNRTSEVDSADPRRLYGLRTPGCTLGLVAYAIGWPHHQHDRGDRTGVPRGILTGRGARIVADHLLSGDRQRYHLGYLTNYLLVGTHSWQWILGFNCGGRGAVAVDNWRACHALRAGAN